MQRPVRLRENEAMKTEEGRRTEEAGPTLEEYYSQHDLKTGVARYVFAGRYVSGKECLEVGCGVGYGAKALEQSGAKVVTAGDVYEKGVRSAASHYAGGQLRFLVMDAQHLPFRDQSFDVLVSIETIEHLEKPGQFIAECRRLLRPNGTLVLSTPNRRIYEQKDPRKESPICPFHMSPSHIKEFAEEELRRLLWNEGFQVDAVFGQEFIKKTLAWKARNLALWSMRGLARRVPGGDKALGLLRRSVAGGPQVQLADWHRDVDALGREETTALVNEIHLVSHRHDLGVPFILLVVARKQ